MIEIIAANYYNLYRIMLLRNIFGTDKSMDIKTLRYFLAVAREENMTRAAETLHVTQSTLSKQMKALEAELGKDLFMRHAFSIELTDEGQLLRKRAEDLVDMADKIFLIGVPLFCSEQSWKTRCILSGRNTRCSLRLRRNSWHRSDVNCSDFSICHAFICFRDFS